MVEYQSAMCPTTWDVEPRRAAAAKSAPCQAPGANQTEIMNLVGVREGCWLGRGGQQPDIARGWPEGLTWDEAA
jgi:hypothetical protein